MCPLLEVTDVLRFVGMKERSVMCASIALHVQLSLPGSKIFHMHSNYVYLTGLMTELHNFQFADKWYPHDIPKLFFQQVC